MKLYLHGVILLLPLALSVQSAFAQETPKSNSQSDLIGMWEGALEVDGVSVQDLVWRFEMSDSGSLAGFMGPAEAGAVLPMSDLLVSESALSFNLNSQGAFEGSIYGAEISGLWTDKDEIAELNMKKSAAQEKTPREFTGSDRTWLGTGEARSSSVDLGDFDGDGDVDIVIGNGRHWPQRNELFINNGTGRFSKSKFLGESLGTTYMVKCVDVDGDGDLDILVGNEALENEVHLNDGQGNFELGSLFGGSKFGVRDLVHADFDGDGFVDVFEFTRAGPNAWFLNDGAGRFTMEDTVGARRDSIGAAISADLNGDQLMDLVLVDRDGGKNSILFGGGGVFDSTQTFGRRGAETHDVAIADMDGDGRLDIITSSIGQPHQIHFGDESQKFRDVAEFGSEARGYAVAVGDLDNDGDIDVVVGNQTSKNVAYFNNGDGRSFQRLAFGPVAYTYDIALADLNGDGYLDVVTANTDSHNQVFFNVAPR